LTLVVALLGAAMVVAVSLPLLTADGRARVVRRWFRALLHACGVRLVVRGERLLSTPDARVGTLIASNHVSWLDIAALLAVEPVRVLAKSDVRAWPVVGMLAARAGTLFIDRRRLRRLPATVAEIAAALRGGRSVLVFPEGSTWCGRTRGRFHPATLQAAIDGGTVVRPVLLGYWLADHTPTTAAAFVGDDSLLASVRRVVATRGLVAEVRIGPVLSPRDATRRTLAAATYAALEVSPEPMPVPAYLT
jgi:1-acyl-sn-glycerol-3-phosphate acyltransferase